jgi:hypothetical protein
MRSETRIVSPPTTKVYRNADDIAKWLRITRDYVSSLVKGGVIKYAANQDGDRINGKYDLFEVVGDYIAYLNSKRKEKPVTQTELDQARIERIKGQSERDQIENLMLMGKIALLDDVDAEVVEMLVATRTKLLALPSHITRLLLGKEDFDEVCGILTTEIENCLSELRPINRDSIRGRNQKLKNYQDIGTTYDQEAEATA